MVGLKAMITIVITVAAAIMVAIVGNHDPKVPIPVRPLPVTFHSLVFCVCVDWISPRICAPTEITITAITKLKAIDTRLCIPCPFDLILSFV